MFYLCDGKLDAESHKIGNSYSGENGEEAVKHNLPERKFGSAQCQPVLISGIVHAEKKAGQQSGHHDNHGALAVDAVVDVNRTISGRCSAWSI